jgi:hypothetical protein
LAQHIAETQQTLRLHALLFAIVRMIRRQLQLREIGVNFAISYQRFFETFLLLEVRQCGIKSRFAPFDGR